MSDELKPGMGSRTSEEKTPLGTWLIILAIALLFFCYGLFMFLAVLGMGCSILLAVLIMTFVHSK